METADRMVVYSPPSLYLRHWDEISGEGPHRYQTLNLTPEETLLLKKFLREAKEISIRIGIHYDSEDMANGNYYMFLFDSSRSDEEEYGWPIPPEDSPKLRK